MYGKKVSFSAVSIVDLFKQPIGVPQEFRAVLAGQSAGQTVLWRAKAKCFDSSKPCVLGGREANRQIEVFVWIAMLKQKFNRPKP